MPAFSREWGEGGHSPQLTMWSGRSGPGLEPMVVSAGGLHRGWWGRWGQGPDAEQGSSVQVRLG